MAAGFNEALLHVFWTHHSSANQAVSGHQMFRTKVSCDLGLDYSPDFTREEMELIMYAAKMQAVKCLRARKKGRRE